MRGINQTKIPMTPNEKVVWDLYELPRLGALVISAPDCDDSVIELMANASLWPHLYQRERRRAGSKGQSGDNGTVYHDRIKGNPLAIKLFKEPSSIYNECHQGLSGIRANVALSAGLAHLALTGKNSFDARPVRKHRAARSLSARFTITAPTYHAALISTDPETPTVWAMSYEAGVASDRTELPVPPYAAYADVLDAALEAVGLDSYLVQHDPNAGNLLARQAAAAGIDAEIVKLDCFADELLDF